MLYGYISEQDVAFSAVELIEKYRLELEGLCKYDKDTVELFGHVNTWWVFGKVSQKLNYDIFMAEAENVGYKRTKRGEKEMPNDLFTLEYAPETLNVLEVYEKYDLSLANINKLISNWNAKLTKEKKKDEEESIKAKLQVFSERKTEIESEYEHIKVFISKYYDEGTLLPEFSERTDTELVKEFKSGCLSDYCSYRVALHKSVHTNILDYMRDIVWE